MSKQFVFGLLPDAAPIDKLGKRWSYLEVPGHIHCAVELGPQRWEEMKSMYKKDGRPVLASSHLLPGQFASGPNFNKEFITYILSVQMPRMAELGVKYVGCYGGHFGLPKGYSATKAKEQALESINIMADFADKYNMEIALEPIGNPETLMPRYIDGLDIIKELGRKSIKIMADMDYFAPLGRGFEDILIAPELCINVHIGGDGAQPNVGNEARHESLLNLFRNLREAGYDKGVTAACPWVITNGAAELDWHYETEKCMDYLEDLKAQTYK